MVGPVADEPIQHFSHPHHPLELTNSATANMTDPCSGCKLPPSGSMFTCKTCNFTLHPLCTKMRQLIKHPSHPNHPLELLPKPIYPDGSFDCDGCGHRGHGFTYHCSICNFDLHMLCVLIPLSHTHQSHACKPTNPMPVLMLTFDPPYQSKIFSCRVCNGLIGPKHWFYHCKECNFDAHLDCVLAGASGSAVQTQIRSPTNNSLPLSPAGQMQLGSQPAGVNQLLSGGTMLDNQVPYHHLTGGATMNNQMAYPQFVCWPIQNHQMAYPQFVGEPTVNNQVVQPHIVGGNMLTHQVAHSQLVRGPLPIHQVARPQFFGGHMLNHPLTPSQFFGDPMLNNQAANPQLIGGSMLYNQAPVGTTFMSSPLQWFLAGVVNAFGQEIAEAVLNGGGDGGLLGGILGGWM